MLIYTGIHFTNVYINNYCLENNIVDYAAYKATALNATEFAGNDLYSLNTEDTSNAQTVGLFDKGNSINQKLELNDKFLNLLFRWEFINFGVVLLTDNFQKNRIWQQENGKR